MVALTILDGFTLLQESIVGLEAQGLGGHGQHIVLLHRVDGHVSRQTGLQLQVVVGSRDYHLIGHHITFSGCLLAHLCHLSLKMVVWESIHGKTNALPLLHTTYVSLVDISNHTHVCQVLGYHEELRGVKRGGNRLTLLYSLRENHTVDRRRDGGVAEVGLGLLHTLTRGVHLLLGL